MKRATFFLAILAAIATARAERPNIVLIYTDDQGYGDVSALNDDAKLRTPNLDRLAQEGMVFTDAHSPDTVCTPSRYGLLTGRYAWRTQLKRGVFGAEADGLIERDRLTLPELLQDHGYQTAMVGKWHLGIQFPGTKGDRDWSKPFTDGPQDHGFDYFYGIPASMNFGVLAWFEGRFPNTPPTLWTQKKPSEIAMRDFRFKPPYSESREGGNDIEVAPDFVDVEALTRFTEKALDWLGSAAKKARNGRPFFLYLPYTSPHKPVIPIERFRGDTDAGAYGDFIRETDWHVGRILEKLKEAGVAENTLVVFTSDNGPENTWRPRIDRYGHDSSGIYRGGKRHLYEGGHRMPFLVRWPGVVEAGSTCDATICQTDLLATVADILDADLPADEGVDSESILPALRGKDFDRPLRGAVVHHSAAGYFAIRMGPWKLNFGRGPQGRKEPEKGELPFELYNLAEDPGETTNLYEKHPEVVARLKKRMIEIVERGRSTPGPPQENEGGPRWRGLGWMPEP